MKKEKKGGDEENGGKDGAEETKATRSFVSFSSVKETAGPWYPPLLSLRDDMMDPDRGGSRRMGEGRREARRGLLRLLSLGEGDEGALASSSPVFLGGDVGPESISPCTNNET